MQHQNIADAIKAIVLATRADGNRSRPAAIKAIQQFEGAPWNPEAFAAVLARRDDITRADDEFTTSADDPSFAVYNLLEDYAEEMSLPPFVLFSTKDAARYIGKHYKTVQNYNLKGYLRGSMVGKTIAYHRHALNNLMERSLPKPGPKPTGD